MLMTTEQDLEILLDRHTRARANGFSALTISGDAPGSEMRTVEVPGLAPDEVLIGVAASSINFNTQWAIQRRPVDTRKYVRRFAQSSQLEQKHDQEYQVIGSDAAGIIVDVGAGVRAWTIGDEVVVAPVVVDAEDPQTHDDSMLGSQRAWGYETNFGGLAEFAVVRASQLLRKPQTLTWEEAAAATLCGGTAYRMLVSENGARMKQGDAVLIWGASGGVGAFAMQLVRNGGGIPVGVVSSERKAMALRRLGFDRVIVQPPSFRVGADPGNALTQLKDFGQRVRAAAGRDPMISVDHVGADSFEASLFVLANGGAIVTCGSTTGYRHAYDNRQLWMKSRRIIGCHGANLRENALMQQLLADGAIISPVTRTIGLRDVGDFVGSADSRATIGKVAVRCQATATDGIRDPDLRRAQQLDARRGLWADHGTAS